MSVFLATPRAQPPDPGSPGAGGATTHGPRPLGHGARAVVRLVGIYQALRAGRPSPCRFWPTCSAYAVEAIERHGTARGSVLAARRVLRCHPWGGSGVDMVPE